MPRRNRQNRRRRKNTDLPKNTNTTPRYPSFEFDASIPETSAVKRLMRDLSELQREELDTIAACPLEDNILEWHVNITDPAGAYQGVYLHCVMTFPTTYPNMPPKVKLLTSIPHPNIMDSYICLSMLTSYGRNRADSFEGWSSAYSVTSILCQLQSFFFADHIRQDTGRYYSAVREQERIDYARSKALAFKCTKCSHTHDNPHPRISLFDRRSNEQSLSPINRDSFNKWLDLPQDCCFVMMEFLDSISLYRASWTTREWWNVYNKYSLNARQNVRCFHTKLTQQKCVLGFGFRKLGSGMYTSQMDYLSELAWTDGVREDVWGSRLDAFIPLILNRNHGERALPLLRLALSKINTNPVFALAKLMNDIVVVLAKNVSKANDSKLDVKYECIVCNAVVREHWTTCNECGQSTNDGIPIGLPVCEKLMEMNVSEKALLGYSSLHHVLLYLVEHDVDCKRTVETVVQDLVDGRVQKNQTRDLGQALVLVSAVDNVVWEDISKRFTMEGWIRKVRWFTRNGSESWNSPNVDNYRDIFMKCSVSLCVVMFQVRFLSLVGQNSRSQCLAQYHRRLGRPSRASVLKLRGFCADMERVMSRNVFDDRYRYYWKAIGFRVVAGNDFIHLLRSAVKISSKRQYHRHDDRVWNDWTTPRGFQALNCFVHRSEEDDENDRWVNIHVPSPERYYRNDWDHGVERDYAPYPVDQPCNYAPAAPVYMPIQYGVPVGYPVGYMPPPPPPGPYGPPSFVMSHPGYPTVPPMYSYPPPAHFRDDSSYY